MYFFLTQNEIEQNNAKNIDFCFFWSEKVFPLVLWRPKLQAYLLQLVYELLALTVWFVSQQA